MSKSDLSCIFIVGRRVENPLLFQETLDLKRLAKSSLKKQRAGFILYFFSYNYRVGLLQRLLPG